MKDRRPPAFEPKPIDRFDLANPMSAGTSRLPSPDAARLHGERIRQARNFTAFGPRTRRRMAFYAVGGAITLPVLQGLFRLFLHVGPGLWAPWIQVPVGALLGAVVAFLRPGRSLCGFLVAGAALILDLLYRGLSVNYLVVLYLAVWFCLGMAVGIDEEMRREEGF